MKLESDLPSLAHYVMDQTRRIIEECGPRPPGSPGEKQAQDKVKAELAGYVDAEPSLMPFEVAPEAFMAAVPVAGCLALLGLAIHRVSPLLALALTLAALALLALHLARYRLVLAPLFPRRTSHNVYGVRRAAESPKRRVILGGHIDAAYEWRFNLMGPKMLWCAGGWAISALIVCPAVYVVQWIWGDASPAALEILSWCFAPAGILALLFTRFSVVSPGANDNLSGTFLALAAMKYLHEKGVRFEDTEVGCLITGSEEAGLCGAKAFVKQHREELAAVPTVFLALDTFRDTEHLAVYNRDMTGTVKHDEAVCAWLKDAGLRNGLDLPYEAIYVGASDAAAFTQAGIPAAAFAGMDPGPPQYYHTRLDTADNMNAECLEKAMGVVLEALTAYGIRGVAPSTG